MSIQDLLNRDAEMTRRLRSVNPEARCIYSPEDGRYRVFIGTQAVTQAAYTTRVLAILAATEVLG